MDWAAIGPSLVDLLIEAGPALAGVAMGGAISVASTHMLAKRQRNWAIQDGEEERKAERMREVRARADERALRSLESVLDLEFLIRRRIRVSTTRLWSDAGERAESKALLRRIQLDTEFLPLEVRQHVLALPRLFPELDQLLYQRYITDNIQSVAHNTIASAKQALSNYLRGEPVPSELSLAVDGYLTALNKLEDYNEYQLEQQIAADERREGGE